MKRIAILLVAVVMVAGVTMVRGAVASRAQTPSYGSGSQDSLTAKQSRGATPYIELKDEPPPKLIVDPPLPDLLDQGVVWIQWRAENVHIVPVFGKGALNVSPRAGHLHVTFDDNPWLWADASDINTIDLAGVPPGPHKIKIDLVNTNHEVFPGQSRTLTFTVGKAKAAAHGPSH